jgi:hypothetical protein
MPDILRTIIRTIRKATTGIRLTNWEIETKSSNLPRKEKVWAS